MERVEKLSSLYPGSMQVEPMRYGNKPAESIIEKTWESGDWFMQEKKDGAWYQLEKTVLGEVYLFGRTKSKVTGEYTEKIANVPHIKEWADKHLPNATTLIGEIYVPGGKSNDVTKIMGCTPKNAQERQYEPENFNLYGGPIHYYVFDMIRYAGKDMCNEGAYQRYRYLEIDLGKAFLDGSWVELAPICEDNFEEHLKNIFAAGGEGAVFKKKDCPYRPGKRTTTSQMYKYKEHLDSIDLICMELLDPVMDYTGKGLDTWPYWYDLDEDETYYWEFDFHNPTAAPYSFDDVLGIIPVTKPFYYGWKNAIRLGAYKDGKIIEVGKVASGLTDADRENMALHPEKWLNKVIEVECMSTTKDGALRHPVFKRVREDKGPDDCLWDEIFQ